MGRISEQWAEELENAGPEQGDYEEDFDDWFDNCRMFDEPERLDTLRSEEAPRKMEELRHETEAVRSQSAWGQDEPIRRVGFVESDVWDIRYQRVAFEEM